MLTDSQCKRAIAASKISKLPDGGGLYLWVYADGKKYWRFRYKKNGTEQSLSLGVYPAVSLAEARVRRDEEQARLRAGLDPSQERKHRSAMLRTPDRTLPSVPRQKDQTSKAPALLKRGNHKRTVRGRLMDAGYRLMSRKGLDGCSLAEIISEAEVGVGSFYNHFSSKEDLAKAVFAERAKLLGETLERVAHGTTNIVAATCFSYRSIIREVERDQVWASFIIHLEPSMQMLDGLLRGYARAALNEAIADGRLKDGNVETLITAAHALFLAFSKAMLNGELTPAEAHRASLYVLRLYNYPEQEIMRVSSMAMEDLARELGLAESFILRD